MLAEPRSRQKWSADPRNTTWANDKTKFGYQMMNKMGWSEGQGLGKNLSGETKHIGVRKKKGQHGIGASAFTDDNWIAHQDDFNALLGALNQGLPCPEAPANDAISKKIASLENTVKKSSKKIHYKKYVQGKDLSRASENDLASIFGQRAKSAPSTPQLSGDEDGNESDGTSFSEPDQGVQIITATMDMNEYFAIKMEAFKERREARRRDERLAKERGEDLNMNVPNQKQVTLYLDNDPTSMEGQTTTEVKPEKKKKKKKKKTKHEKEANTEELQEQTTEIPDQPDSDLLEKAKKKKKKRKTNSEEGNEIADDIQTATVIADEKPAVLSDSENRELKKKKKKKKNKDPLEVETNATADDDTQQDSGIDSPSTTEQTPAQTNDSEIKKKKKKKKIKELEKENTDVVSTTTVETNSKTDNNSETVESIEPTNLKKKKKKRKHAEIEEQPAVAEVAEETQEPAVKKKKKKRKKCETEEG